MNSRETFLVAIIVVFSVLATIFTVVSIADNVATKRIIRFCEKDGLYAKEGVVVQCRVAKSSLVE